MSNSTALLLLTRQRRRVGERIIMVILQLCAAVSVVTTFGIILSLIIPSVEFFRSVPITNFL